jgi:hypothetical protein
LSLPVRNGRLISTWWRTFSMRPKIHERLSILHDRDFINDVTINSKYPKGAKGPDYQ